MSDSTITKPPRKPRKKAVLPPISREDLLALVRELVATRPGVSGTELKKVLPVPVKPQANDALDLLRDLAANGETFRHAKRKKERFFAEDPIATLDRLVPGLLRRQGPLDDVGLKKALAVEAAGYVDLLPEWRKSALGRRLVFEHGPVAAGPGKKKGGKKRLAAEPDLLRLLGKTLTELRWVLSQVETAGVGVERVLDVVRTEMGLAPVSPLVAGHPALAGQSVSENSGLSGSAADADKEVVLNTLLQIASEHRPGTLLLTANVRKRTTLDKASFDSAAIALSRDGKVVLHNHDHPAALPESERELLVSDGRDIFYIGMAPRSDT